MPDVNQVLYLASLGLRVHPLSPRNKVPLVDEWTRNASAKPTVIKKWVKLYPECNWGIATGFESKVFVVDIDPKNGGTDTWAQLIEANSPPPKTLEVVTGTGGTHLYFEYPTKMAVSNSAIGKGVDIRGEGGNIVIPPSIHPNGREYMWAKNRAPDKIKVAVAPTWLLKKIKEVAVIDFPSMIGTKIEKGERNNTIFHQSLLLARQGAMFNFVISAMKAWVKETKEFDMKEREIEDTVESAFKFHEGEKLKRKSLEAVELSDVGNTRRLLDGYKDLTKYAVGLGFHVWDTKRWGYDIEGLQVKQQAIATMDRLRDETLEELKAKSDKQSSNALLRIHSWAISSHNASRLSSMVELSKSYPAILKQAEDLDSPETAFLLNMNNGTLDLKTGSLSPHNKDQFITRLCPFDYNPAAKCPTWLKTLDLAFNGDKELIAYFRRAVGYSLSGDISEQCFFICWGPEGANGKSTMLEAIQRILGSDYAIMSDARVISSKEKDNHVLASLAQLNGVRIVSVNEFGENAVLDEELIKQLTGGDTVQAKSLYMAPFTFKPVFKIWVRANAKPIVRGTGNAFWRRVKLIPFEHAIPEKHRKPRHTIDAMLLKEAEGIIAWAVEGFKDWHENGGLRDPQIVAQASAAYRNESDIVNMFWDECVETSANQNSSVPRSILYSTFREWAQQQGVRFVMTNDKFTRRVQTKLNQFDRTRDKTGIAIWQGITLNKYAVATFGGGF